MAEKVHSRSILYLTFLPVPRIDKNEKLEFSKGKIVLKGHSDKSEVWSTDLFDARTLLENFVLAVSDIVDPNFTAKLILQIEPKSTPLHPSDPDWAYSKIDVSEIPMLKISDDIWDKIINRLMAYDDGSWENETNQNDRFLFKK